MSTKGENEMVNGEEMKDSSIKPIEMRATSESIGAKSQQTEKDDPERVGGDIQTRSPGEAAGATETQEEDEQPKGGSTSTEEDDPERGA